MSAQEKVLEAILGLPQCNFLPPVTDDYFLAFIDLHGLTPWECCGLFMMADTRHDFIDMAIGSRSTKH